MRFDRSFSEETISLTDNLKEKENKVEQKDFKGYLINGKIILNLGLW